MTQTEARIQKMAAQMVRFSIKGFTVSKAEKAELMAQALVNAADLVAKMGHREWLGQNTTPIAAFYISGMRAAA